MTFLRGRGVCPHSLGCFDSLCARFHNLIGLCSASAGSSTNGSLPRAPKSPSWTETTRKAGLDSDLLRRHRPSCRHRGEARRQDPRGMTSPQLRGRAGGFRGLVVASSLRGILNIRSSKPPATAPDRRALQCRGQPSQLLFRRIRAPSHGLARRRGLRAGARSPSRPDQTKPTDISRRQQQASIASAAKAARRERRVPLLATRSERNRASLLPAL
jgi:hypothetical protein